MAFSKVDFRPAARTATSVTSASPIISADAVEAVRAGLRIAFPRASRPATAADLRRRAIRAPRASGGTSVLASIATPTNKPAAPRPIASRRVPAESEPANRPTSISATATPIVSDAVTFP